MNTAQNPRAPRITEHELAVAKIKLLGLMLLAVVDMAVIAWARLPF